jgi:hypothetical protein
MSELGDQASLFDDPGAGRPPGAPAPAIAVDAEEGSPMLDGWFLPTNRHNILKMLAVRAVLPVEAFADKYYDDLLTLTPGRLPLIRGGMPSDLASIVAEEEFDFPILLEINAEPADRPVGQQVGDTWCPAGPIPLPMVRAIHFRTEGELAEFEQNEYADVRPVRELHVVSPNRFAASRPIPELLDELRAVEPAALSRSIDALDRRGGALLLALLAARQPAAEALISAMRGDPTRAESPAVDGVAVWLADATTSPATVSEHSEEALRAQRILTTLEGIDRRAAWRPLEIIEALRATLPVDMPEVDQHLIDTALSRATAILRSDEEFTGLKEGGSAALKALLLVLMRPELERLNPSELEGQGVDDDVRLLAAAMLGAMTGRSRLPVEARPILLDDLLAHWECDQLRVLDNPTPPVPDLTVERGETGPSLAAGSVKVLSIAAGEAVPESEPPTPAEGDKDESELTDRLAKILSGDVARTEAIRVAIDHEWWAAIITTIVLPHAMTDVALKVDPFSSLSLSLRGHAEVRQVLDDQVFVGSVAEAPDRDAIVARLTDSGVTRRKPRSAKPKT